VDAGVIQSPRYLIKAKGGKSTLQCFPISGHISVSWYQQTPDQGPQLLIEHYEKMPRNEENIPNRFTAQQFNDYHSELNMSALELGDSAVYLCASSLAQPYRVSGFLYPNLPVSADNLKGK
jgi:T-cell receptor beta chain V region